jgi:hypothetical protein
MLGIVSLLMGWTFFISQVGFQFGSNFSPAAEHQWKTRQLLNCTNGAFGPNFKSLPALVSQGSVRLCCECCPYSEILVAQSFDGRSFLLLK